MSASFQARSVVAGAIALTFAGGTFAASPAHAPLSATKSQAFSAAPAPSGGAPLLFNQSGSPRFEGVLAMRNLDQGQEIYDTEMADDFVVPAGGWAVSVVRIGSFYHSGGTPVNPATSGNITFYNDSGTGGPGAAIPGCAYQGVSLFYSEDFLTSVLALPEICPLPQGKYWMGFSGNLSFDAQEGGVFVTQETTTPNSPTVWRNPGGGYDRGCTNWGALTTCGFPSNGGMTFQLYGQTTPVSLQSFSVE